MASVDENPWPRLVLSSAAMIVFALNLYDVYLCMSEEGSNSSHSSTGLKEGRPNSGDYCLSLPPSLFMNHSPSVSYPIFCIKHSVYHFSPCFCDDHGHEHCRDSSRLPQKIW